MGWILRAMDVKSGIVLKECNVSSLWSTTIFGAFRIYADFLFVEKAAQSTTNKTLVLVNYGTAIFSPEAFQNCSTVMLFVLQ